MRPELVATRSLSAGDRDAMCGLLASSFLGVDSEGFVADLADKDYALVLRDEAGRICGFTTLALAEIPGRPGEWVLFSGDTIVDSAHRTSNALAAGWIDAVEQLRAERYVSRLVWLLICSSVRTYRFLSLFFRDFAPHPERPTDPAVKSERDALASWRYGARYQAGSGVVVLERPQTLRPDQVEAPFSDPALAAFFECHNPGWRGGDELVCHCVVEDDNLTAAGRRMVLAGRRRRAGE